MLLDISARLDYEIDDDTTVLLQIEAASAPDQRIVRARTDVADPAH